MAEPASYVALAATGELQRRADAAWARLRACDLCPRRCGVDRVAGQAGYCRASAELVIASDTLHFGEEPPITGTGGSGTVFVAHCALRCCYCQNWPFSHLGHGDTVAIPELAKRLLRLQRRGAHNLNFVNPTHYLPHIVAALALAAPQGLAIPVVWNCSGYEAVDALRLLDGIVDIYLPDAKHATAASAQACCGTPDYPEVNRAALREMWRQVGRLRCDDDGIAVRGLIVRHLVLPDGLSDTPTVLRWLHDELSPDVYIALMSQYFPTHLATDHPRLGRRVSAAEYRAAFAVLEELDFTDGMAQPVPDDELP